MRRHAESEFAELYEDAREAARLSLLEHDEDQAAAALPPVCPYTLDQVLDRSWYPDPPRSGSEAEEGNADARRNAPDGPGYDEDFYAWTQYQAEVLRAMPCDDNRFDRENVAEEIEDLGRNERDAVTQPGSVAFSNIC